MNDTLIKHTVEENNYYKNELKLSIKEFMNYTKSEDYMGIILRAQIYIERDLNTLISQLLIHPEKINLQFFSAKLDAAYALGAIDDEWYGALKKFSKIRNKYAHDLFYTFTQTDYDDLISTLSKDAKSEFLEHLNHEKWLQILINSFKSEASQTDLKLYLRILLSELMVYMRQQIHSIEYIVEDMHLALKCNILNKKIDIINQAKNNNKFSIESEQQYD